MQSQHIIRIVDSQWIKSILDLPPFELLDFGMNKSFLVLIPVSFELVLRTLKHHIGCWQGPNMHKLAWDLLGHITWLGWNHPLRGWMETLSYPIDLWELYWLWLWSFSISSIECWQSSTSLSQGSLGIIWLTDEWSVGRRLRLVDPDNVHSSI